ncbi:hypothetical protein Tco_0498604, partial [Tanacetum coccineum]
MLPFRCVVLNFGGVTNAENEIDDNTISYDQYLLDKEAQRVPTEISA